ARAINLARELLGRVKPDIVVGAGGYASAPISVAAISRRIPLVLMEQNTRPGLANRMLWRFARRICVGFDEAAPFFGGEKVQLTGNPVRDKISLGQSPGSGDSFQILVLGGSSGAHHLNLGVLNAFKKIEKSVIKLTVLHQTGAADAALVERGYAEVGL